MVVDPSQGVDSRVDYSALLDIAPWDDRNYQLSQDDLAVLPEDERRRRDPIPVFFRVALCRENPLVCEPGTLYPRSAFNVFKQEFGGFLYRGNIYRKIERDQDGVLRLLLEDGVKEENFEEYRRALEGEVRVTSPVGAAESAIKIHPVDTDIVVAGSNGPGGGQKMHYSDDGGESWTETTLPLGGTCCDPTIDYKSDGSFVYAATLGGCGFLCNIWFYRSSDNGQTWDDLSSVTPGDPRRELTNSNVSDKEFMHVDKHAGSAHQDNIYLTWHDSNVIKFASSTDDGNSFTVRSTGEGGSIGGDIATDKAGVVYHFWPNTVTERIRLERSSDGGASFVPITTVADTNDGFDFAVPAMDTRLVFIYVSADADLSDGPYGGSVYAAWTDTLGPESGTPANNHARIQVGYSRDGGSTWTMTTPHETADAMTVDRFHQWLAVGPDGTVHIVFYDTREGSRDSVDLYYSNSTDGAQTWSAPAPLTSVTSPKINDGFEWGDYNGLDAVLDRVMAIYTDNRNEGGGGGDSIDVYSIGFTTAASDDIFADGFESEDTGAWSSTVP